MRRPYSDQVYPPPPVSERKGLRSRPMFWISCRALAGQARPEPPGTIPIVVGAISLGAWLQQMCNHSAGKHPHCLCLNVRPMTLGYRIPYSLP